MPTISPIIQNGRCIICGRKTRHLNLWSIKRNIIYQHRLTEQRKCISFEVCLMEAALEDWICIPCIMCKSFEIKEYTEM